MESLEINIASTNWEIPSFIFLIAIAVKITDKVILQ
jgi:hypothetical protein